MIIMALPTGNVYRCNDVFDLNSFRNVRNVITPKHNANRNIICPNYQIVLSKWQESTKGSFSYFDDQGLLLSNLMWQKQLIEH